MTPAGGTAGRRRWRVLAALCGVLVALGAGEIVLRLTDFGHYAPREDHYELVKLDGDPTRLYWGLDPQRVSWQAWDGDPYGTLPPGAVLRYDDVNAEGLRGPLPPDDGTPRVLFVGDSFTFGEGVRDGDTFVAAVGRAVATDAGPVAVLNAGVPGYGTFEEALRLPALLERFRPRVVVVVVTPNDAIHVSASREQGDDLLRYGDRDDDGLRLAALLRRVAGSAARERETERWYLSYYTGEQSAAWRRMRVGLREMHAMASRAGASFAVVYFPLLHRLEDGPLDPIRDLVRDACAADDVPFLDLGEAFVGLAGRDLWVHPADHHPNARAHAAAARAMTPFVRHLMPRR